MSRAFYRLLTGLDQEQARRFGLKAAILAYDAARLAASNRKLPALPVEAMGLRFPNPVGMAAGMDRTGELYPHLTPSGFGFMELGSIDVGTPVADLPPLACIPWSRGSRHLQDRPLLGISLSSLRERFDRQMQGEYIRGFEAVHAQADYVTLNLSRPGAEARSGNVKAGQLAAFLDSMVQARQGLTSKQYRPPPMLIKVAIREDHRETVTPVLHAVKEAGLHGFIAAFEHWRSVDRMCRSIERMARYLDPIPLIAVGGIYTSNDAWLRLEAGAALVQLYHAFLERGPFVARKIVNGLLARQPIPVVHETRMTHDKPR